MPPPGPDVRERQQQQADEDVRSVEAGEAEEDRAERSVTRREADVDVLVDLDEQEGRTEQPGESQAELESAVVVVLDRFERVLTVNEEETRTAVLMPAMSTGSSTPSGGQAAGSATTRRKK